LYLRGQQTVAQVDVVAHFTGQTAIAGVIDVAGVDAEIVGFAGVADQAVARIASNTYSVAANGFAVACVVHAVS